MVAPTHPPPNWPLVGQDLNQLPIAANPEIKPHIFALNALIEQKRWCRFVRINPITPNIVKIGLGKILIKSLWSCENNHSILGKVGLNTYVNEEDAVIFHVAIDLLYTGMQIYQLKQCHKNEELISKSSLCKVAGGVFSSFFSYMGNGWNSVGLVLDCLMLSHDIHFLNNRVSFADALRILDLGTDASQEDVIAKHDALLTMLRDFNAIKPRPDLLDAGKHQILEELANEAREVIFDHRKWIR